MNDVPRPTQWRGEPAFFARRTKLAAVLSLCLGGALAWFGPAEWRIYQAKEAVRERLRDPGSAVFAVMTYDRGTGAVCGGVNARNAFGGYVGFRAFIFDKYSFIRFNEAGDLDDPDLQRRREAIQDAIRFREVLDRSCPALKE